MLLNSIQITVPVVVNLIFSASFKDEEDAFVYRIS